MISSIQNPFTLPVPQGFRPVSPNGTPNASVQNAPRASAVSIHSTSHLAGTLQLQTQEGDVVSLSLSQDRDVTYSRVAARGRHGHGGSLTQTSTSEQSAFSIQVQGSINEKEQADIDALVSTFRRAAELFANGDQAGANELLAQFQTNGALEGFKAGFESSQTLDVVRANVGRGPARPAPTGEPVATKPDAPAPKPAAAPTPVRQQVPAPIDADGDHDGDTGAGDRTPVGVAAPATTPAPNHDDLIRRLDEGRRQFAAWLQDTQPQTPVQQTLASALASASATNA